MMNRILIGFICLTLSYSCSDKYYSYQPTISNEELPNTCKDLTTKITANWRKHKKLPIYGVQEGEIPTYTIQGVFITDLLISYRDCLIGLKKDKIHSLFGTPSEFKESRHNYFLNETCLEKYKGCPYLYFTFDAQNKVSDYQFETIEVFMH
jgi:hypothetical protein